MKYSNRLLTIGRIQSVIILLFIFTPGFLNANELLTITVKNQQNELLRNAVISAFPQKEHLKQNITVQKTIMIDQIDKEFITHITAIQTGTRIDFPNHDQIHHHVYSFSSTKPFDIPLYKGSPNNTILFDKVGVVALGCNIHDWMSAYIYVTDTPYFSISNEQGKALLNLPSGLYDIHYWHPNIDEKSTKMIKSVKISSGIEQDSFVQINLKQTWALRRAPLFSFNRGQYR